MAINQVMHCVRERPFSIEFMTCHKKEKEKKADAAKVLKVCGVHYGLTQESRDGRQGPLLHNDFAAGLYVKMR